MLESSEAQSSAKLQAYCEPIFVKRDKEFIEIGNGIFDPDGALTGFDPKPSDVGKAVPFFQVSLVQDANLLDDDDDCVPQSGQYSKFNYLRKKANIIFNNLDFDSATRVDDTVVIHTLPRIDRKSVV